MIPIFYPYQGANKEILKELKNTLSSRWWGQGPKVDLVEKEFSKKFGYKYPLFVNSGTSALELVYHLMGLKEGDEVIVPVLDCTAGQTGLLRRMVKIIFADIEKETLNIDPTDLEKKITKKTKAIVIVYLGGVLVNEKIFKIAKKYKIPVIVDAAQHHEPITLPGDYVTYSFQAIKTITTGDGGMLCLKNKKDYKRAKLLRWFGIDREQKAKKGWQAWQKRQMTFDIEEAGYKMQPTDIDASFMLVMLKHLDKILEYRKKLVLEYMKNLEKNPDEVMNYITGGSYWLFGIVCEKRDELAEYLKNNNIECNLVHLRNDLFKIFKKFKSPCPSMDFIENKYLYLPLNNKVTIKDVRFICKKIKEFYNGRRN